MNRQQRRLAQQRRGSSFPAGLFAGLLTAAFVILLGAFMRLEPYVILIRSATSALLLSCLVSLGVSIVRLADSEHRKHQRLNRH
jgi:hypothetical protein